jgi:membrane-associated phospholipid phosphatase
MKRLITFFLLFTFSFSAFTQNADIDLLKNINLHRNKNLDPTFRFVTNSVSPLSIAAPVLILSIGLITKDSSLTHKGLFVAESVLGAAFISTVLKYSVNRPRPFTTYPFIENVTSAGSPSFPSGHTSDAFALATSLSLAFPKWYVIAPSLLWAASVGYSRMDLGVHYPSDVLAGAIIGAGSAYLCSFVNKKMFQKKHNHSNSVSIGK